MIKLWTINRWLRWSGFRLAVEPAANEDGDTRIGFIWVGWYGSRGWRRWEPK